MVNIDTSTQLISDCTNENMVTERTTEGARPAIREQKGLRITESELT
jgi:hypothetical protein